jgi:HEAT repeat protein
MATVATGQENPAAKVREDILNLTQLGSYREILEHYDSGAVPELIEMLNSDSEEEHWVRVAGVLGVVGDERAVDALIALAEAPATGPGYISEARHSARREAIRALGFLVDRTGHERALAYLIDSLDDDIWRRRNVAGVVSYLDSYEKYDRRLSIYAIFGLALSGHPQAGAALRALQLTPSAGQSRLRAGLDDTLDTWLQVYDVAAERGVAGMYEYYETMRR